MKKNNFGKVFGLTAAAVAVFALVFGGCEDLVGSLTGKTLTGEVTIEGTPQVGGSLTASATTSATAPLVYAWQKKEAPTLGGGAEDEGTASEPEWIPIEGATDATYTPVGDDIGHYVKVVVTAAGYRGALTKEADGTITSGNLQGEGGNKGKGNDNDDDDDDENIGGSGPANSITADVNYVPTNDNVGWDSGAWAGQGTAAETWGLRVTEMPVVYFAVQKTEDQTVTVADGTDAGLVEQAEPGDTWDDAEASDTLAVFKVNANKLHNGKEEGETYDEWYDSMFEGDDFQFTLNVSEDGKDGKTVTVNLRQNADLTKAAVFIVTGTGNDRTLTRQTGMKWYQRNEGDSGSHAPIFDENKEGTRLIDMLVWIDRNLDRNAEYLVRVAAANEEMPSTAITYGSSPENESITKANAPAGKIRLRGAGNTERVIKHDGADRARSNAYFKYIANSQSYIDGLITLWTGGTLQLEKNITIEGDTLDGGKTKVSRLISLYRAHLIMKDGSIIRNSIGKSAIYMQGGSNDTIVGSQITMEGGQITGNIGDYNPIYTTIGVAYKDNGHFTNTGGTVSGNFAANGTTPRNGIIWSSTFVSFD